MKRIAVTKREHLLWRQEQPSLDVVLEVTQRLSLVLPHEAVQRRQLEEARVGSVSQLRITGAHSEVDLPKIQEIHSSSLPHPTQAHTMATNKMVVYFDCRV